MDTRVKQSPGTLNMFKFVILLSFLACALGSALPEGLLPQLDGRIVGGSPTNINSFPWQISLQRNGGHSCGGSIFSSNIIVTAAHCLQNVSPSVLQIRAGSSYWSSGGVLVGVVSWGYGCAYSNYPGVYADVAVLRSWVINNANSI